MHLRAISSRDGWFVILKFLIFAQGRGSLVPGTNGLDIHCAAGTFYTGIHTSLFLCFPRFPYFGVVGLHITHACTAPEHERGTGIGTQGTITQAKEKAKVVRGKGHYGGMALAVGLASLYGTRCVCL